MARNQYIFGMHAVSALVSNHPERIMRLLVAAERGDKKIDAILKHAKKNGITVEKVSRDQLDQLTEGANHQGVVAHSQKARTFDEQDLFAMLEKQDEPAFLLILDGIQDPHNLGACFRSADAAGVHAIIAPKDKSVGITPTVSKVACGAAETVPFVQVTNLARTIEHLQELGVWVYGAAGEAKTLLYQVDWRGPIAIVLGAEGEGLRRLTRDKCDGLVKIPMRGSVSSLNVSVATGIMLFEVIRQRTG